MFSVALFRNGLSPSALAPWGDGLAEQSLADWWYPATWDNVAPDELVVVNPSLAARSSSVGSGPEALLRGVLVHRLTYARQIFSDPALAFRTRALDAARLNDAELAEAPPSRSDPYLRWLAHGQRANRASRQLDFELAVIRSIARLREAATPDAAEKEIDLPEAVTASLHSGANAANITSAVGFAHELLAAATWLGHLLRGRAALMPAFIADTLLDWLPQGSAADPCTAILQTHAEIAVGERALLRCAERVRKSRRPYLVHPRSAPATIPCIETTSSLAAPPYES